MKSTQSRGGEAFQCCIHDVGCRTDMEVNSSSLSPLMMYVGQYTSFKSSLLLQPGFSVRMAWRTHEPRVVTCIQSSPVAHHLTGRIRVFTQDTRSPPSTVLGMMSPAHTRLRSRSHPKHFCSFPSIAIGEMIERAVDDCSCDVKVDTIKRFLRLSPLAESSLTP